MARILFTWEFGAGLGHLNRFIPVAEHFARAAHRIVLAVPDGKALDYTRRAFDGMGGVEVRVGFHWPPPRDPKARQVPTHCLADVLRLFDFHNVAKLAEAVKRWVDLVNDIEPDLVIADFSPTLALAKAGERPFVVLGNGYTIPPVGRLLPPIRPWQETLHAFSRANEAEVLHAANRVRWRLRLPPVDYVADLFGGDRSFVCTIPEFDPYRAYRTVPPMLPFNIAAAPKGAPAGERDRRVFAYLPANHPLLATLMAALGGLDAAVDLYIGDAEGAALPAPPANVTRYAQPLPFAEVLPQARLIVHHGGLGTAYAGLLAATPQAALPINLEHTVTARALTALGVAAAPPPDSVESPALTALLATRLDDPVRAAAAQEAADTVTKGDPQESLEQVIDQCEAML